MSIKNFGDTIGNRSRNLSARSAVPQPTAPPCAASRSHLVKGRRLCVITVIRLSFPSLMYCFACWYECFVSVFCFPAVQNDDRCRATSFCHILSYCQYTSETLSNLWCALYRHVSKRDCRSCHKMLKHLLTDSLSLTFDDETSRKKRQLSRYSDKATYSTTEVRFSALGRFFFSCTQNTHRRVHAVGVLLSFSKWVKLSERDADRSPPSSLEEKNTKSHAPISIKFSWFDVLWTS